MDGLVSWPIKASSRGSRVNTWAFILSSESTLWQHFGVPFCLTAAVIFWMAPVRLDYPPTKTRNGKWWVFGLPATSICFLVVAQVIKVWCHWSNAAPLGPRKDHDGVEQVQLVQVSRRRVFCLKYFIGLLIGLSYGQVGPQSQSTWLKHPGFFYQWTRHRTETPEKLVLFKYRQSKQNFRFAFFGQT